MSRPRMVLMVLAVSVGFVIGIVACDRTRKVAEPERVWTPSVRDLHNSYIDSSDRYTNKPVKISLVAFSYVVVGGRVHWHAGNPDLAPDVVFVTAAAPADNSKHIEISGVCRGRVHNNQLRPTDPKFHVLVEAWSVSPHH